MYTNNITGSIQLEAGTSSAVSVHRFFVLIIAAEAIIKPILYLT